jgi:transaldolase
MSEILRRTFDEFGQSPWLDNLQRSYITSGKLAELISSGVRGLTSNPTIFQKAIQGSDDYDEQFTAEIRSGSTPLEAYWALVVKDINDALDVFADLYSSSSGLDGFVSVEVDPRLAKDGEKTLTAARDLDERINRSNVMIKIPATEEGLPAIQQMISEGRNVNVTLIFSLQRYQQVMDAYVGGLEARAARGLDISSIQSVASFFISRVDNEIDELLNKDGSPEALGLRGKSAIAQARLAYALFQTTFSGERWDKLSALGASVQRPLWASTSTKNPSYSDTLYIDELIGPMTVNTIPEATLNAFAEHGNPSRSIDMNVAAAVDVWKSLREYGVDVDDVARKLEREGVASFIKSFEELVDALNEKAASLG